MHILTENNCSRMLLKYIQFFIGISFSMQLLHMQPPTAVLTIAMLIEGLRHQLHYSIGTQHLDGDCFHKQ